MEDRGPALESIATWIQHRQQPFATTGVAGIPDRALKGHPRPKERRPRSRECHEIRRQVHLLHIADHVAALVEVPPAVGVGLHVLARSGLAKVGCGAEESRRREPLDAIDAKIDAVGLQLGLGIDALNERRLPGDRGPKLLTR